uniref:RNA-directed DNA polymerase n=1 Tax=Haemonchus contortus TaxID=6289 RepID=W6NHJ8_HAECO
MHMSVQKGHMLVLGTNALQALNYTLVRRPGEDCRKDEVAEEALVKPSQEVQSASKATIYKRVNVAPGAQGGTAGTPAANLKLKPQKCVMMSNKVIFLGHEIAGDGKRVDPMKIEKIEKYPKPKAVAELRTFLGMCGYYRKFVLGFSRIARPLFELIIVKAPWDWNETHEEAFGELKAKLNSTPVLLLYSELA